MRDNTPAKTTQTRTIKVDMLARVEGEGGLFIKIKNNAVQDVQLKIFEPPRLFEALLRGRAYSDAPDITARICGICPVAYQMSAVNAMEFAFGVRVTGQLRALRRLLYCGEWIESHVLHVYMLHAPDFLGYLDVLQMSKKYPDAVKKALELKKIGNDIMNVVGGREIHPINVRVGGFYRVPTKAELAPLVDKLKWARDTAYETVKFVATLPFPDFEQNCEYVALSHPDEYPITEGRIVASDGLDIPVEDYEKHFAEEHVAYSNALHSVYQGNKPYLVGPAARYNLNYEKLSPIAKQAAQEINFPAKCTNPFKSIIVRAIETVYACDEALRIVEAYEPPEKPALAITPRSGIGYGCTEAPRGILYHRYRVDAAGMIADAKIVPPTAQNQKMIENDLRRLVTQYMALSDDELMYKSEQAVRNYDPCISCATHFVKLERG